MNDISATIKSPDPVEDALSRITGLLQSGRLGDAGTSVAKLCRNHPGSIDAHNLASQVEQQRGRFDAMLARAEQACAIDSQHLGARFRLFECQLYCGFPDRVLQALGTLEAEANENPSLLCKLAEYYTHCVDHESAWRCNRRAAELAPHDPGILYALASSEIACGDLAEAEVLLTRVIARNPHDYDAYRNRATLRKQRPDANNIDEIKRILHSGVRQPAGEVQLCYALAKEHEDLGEDSEAFRWLERGASKRRSLLSYRVEHDLEVMRRLQAVFDESCFDQDEPGCLDSGPIFVLGLPRSGTTLVDRILSSHTSVASLGEINNFAYSLMHTIGQPGDKLKLIEASANINYADLGNLYVSGTRRYGRSEPNLIDKTPLNYLYIGLIRLALPNARIVHVRRNPMDSCYGMYRTLFRSGYPFSYDFDDLASYYVAYQQLMDHWRRVVPGTILDVSYEALVEDQETVSREIVRYCGLEWQPACLDFHENQSAVATASSAQVRRPVYRDALHRWHRYESQLAPLVRRLEAAGIEI